MIGKIKKFIKKLIFSYRCDSDTFVEHLKNSGADIGERVRVFDPRGTNIDITRPFMLKIGNDVQIASGVTILTHGYDWSVFKGLYNEVSGSCSQVVIGDNCFIGMNATILKGVHIGNNCVIGANSLVNKDIPDNCVAAGNPAKPIMSIEDYYKKRKALQLEEAKDLYRCYVERFKKEPDIDKFDEFFWLFQERKEESLTPGQISKLKLVGTYEKSLEKFLSEDGMFKNFEEFLEYMRKETK